MSDREPALRLDGLRHTYGATPVLRGVELEVERGEFLTLLGPSGCGKTTLLRSVAGFVRPDEGRIVIHGQDMTDRPASRRPVNTVFQRPALLPHLDVAQNVALGLRIAGVKRAERRRRSEEVLALVGLDGFGKRRHHELSGGQMQRVALARALVNRPDVLLLDEPLSALDLKIRLAMERELRRLHRETGATFLYVTHDQREAMALSSRVAVMHAGAIEQCASPEVLCGRPASVFTARFVGDANVLPARIVATRRTPALVDAEVRLADDGRAEGPAWLVLRPEAIKLVEPGAGYVDGVIADLAFRGTGYTYEVRVPGTADPVKLEAPRNGRAPAVGTPVGLDWRRDDEWVLPREEPPARSGAPAEPA